MSNKSIWLNNVTYFNISHFSLAESLKFGQYFMKQIMGVTKNFSRYVR